LKEKKVYFLWQKTLIYQKVNILVFFLAAPSLHLHALCFGEFINKFHLLLIKKKLVFVREEIFIEVLILI
jgi:hypothetical protein